MEKVISFFKSITATFYFNFFELNKVHFGPAKVGEDLNSKFESVSKSFDPRVVQRAPPLSPLPSARRLRAAADRVLLLFVTGRRPPLPTLPRPLPPPLKSAGHHRPQFFPPRLIPPTTALRLISSSPPYLLSMSVTRAPPPISH
jgi:hypothetical protein